MMGKILKVFYVFCTLIVFVRRIVCSLSCSILINSILTMQLAFKNVIQCQKLVREKSSGFERKFREKSWNFIWKILYKPWLHSN